MDTKTRILTIAMGALGAAFIALGTAIALGISTATLGIGAIIAAVAAAIAAIVGFIAKIASEENATVDVTTATERYNDALAEAKTKAEELTMAENDLTRAKKELTEAANQAASAIDTYESAVKRAEETSKALAEAERAQGITGAELHEQVMNGTLVYTNMTDAQKKVYKAYMDNEAAQNALTTATEEVNSIKEKQIELEGKVKEATDKVTEATNAKIEADKKAVMAGWDLERSLAKQEKNYESYRDKVVDAYQKGELAADEAHELISKAMTGMSDDVRQTFTKDLPEDIKDGLNPEHYETTGEKICNWFKNVGNSMVSGFKSIFGIASPSKVMKGIAEDIDAGLRGGISGEKVSSWFSDIGSKMISGFKKLFGIASPSTVMEGFGENIEEGLYNGMDGMGRRFANVFNEVRQKANEILGESIGLGIDFDRWFTNLLIGLDVWFKVIHDKITSWWTDLWNGLSIDLNANVNISVTQSGVSTLGRVTPMSGLPVDGNRSEGTFRRDRVTWNSDNDDQPDPRATSTPAAQSIVDGVTTNVVQALAPFIVNQNNSEQLPPVYVGTLIADDRGLKELERKLRIIRVKEERRGG